MSNTKTHQLRGLVVGLLVAGVALVIPAHSSAASQGFNVLNGSAQTGMVMSLTADPGVVQPATSGTAKSLVGVISPNTDSGLTEQPGQVNVQTDGEANALVSTLNGDIRVGDRITASPLEGVGAKATSNAWIIGIAQASLDSSSSNATRTTITDSRGRKHSVYVAQLPIDIKVTYYSVTNANIASTASWMPPFIQHLADTLAGKHVSTRALIFSFLLFLVGVMAAGLIINAAIRSGFLAIARQPLSKLSILKEERRSFGIAVLILLFTLGAVILLLRVL